MDGSINSGQEHDPKQCTLQDTHDACNHSHDDVKEEKEVGHDAEELPEKKIYVDTKRLFFNLTRD